MQLAALTLPEPQGNITIPVVAVIALVVVFSLVRKLVALALIGVIAGGLVIAYQAGALDHWVDKGKQIINEQGPGK
jgi:hypothetical protein